MLAADLGDAGLALAFLLRRHGLVRWLRKNRAKMNGAVAWRDHGPVPLAEKKYTPQGLTWVAGRLLFANSWKNTRSRVYEFDPATMHCHRHFDMPDEAVHTSGLAWDGRQLWAVDYISNRGYAIDLEASLTAQRAIVRGSFQTTLRGTSACCLVPWNGQTLLAISDFMRTRHTIFVRAEEALAAGTARHAIAFRYLNEGCSQGLECVGGFLYEAENKLGIDVINKIDLDQLAHTRNSHRATVRQYLAPGGGVEDLAWDGEAFWTSDEVSFRFFRARLD